MEAAISQMLLNLNPQCFYQEGQEDSDTKAKGWLKVIHSKTVVQWWNTEAENHFLGQSIILPATWCISDYWHG